MVDKFFKNLINKKRIKPIEKITPLELALLVGLTSYTYQSQEGWMSMREILADKGSDGRHLFKSPKECFPKYIKGLIEKRIVEKRKHPGTDKRGRSFKKNFEYRLNRDNKVKYSVYGLILSSISYHVENVHIGKDGELTGKPIIKSTLKLDIRKILKRSYFDTVDEGYGEIIDQTIKRYEDKIALLKSIKRTRAIKRN